MGKKQKNYTEALQLLEQLQQQMESNEIPIDELAAKVAEAAELLKYCQNALRQTAEQIDEILANDGK